MTEQQQPDTELETTATSMTEADSAAPQTPTQAGETVEQSEASTGEPGTAQPTEDSPAAQTEQTEPSAENPPALPEEGADAPADNSAEGPSAQAEAPAAEQSAPQEEPAAETPTQEAGEQQEADEQDQEQAAPPTPAALPAPAIPAEPVVDPQEAMDAAKWGRVDGEGRVYVQDGGTEREVGQFPDAPIAEAMAFYVRRYLDLKSTVDLFATRLPQLSVREIDSTLKSIEESLVEPAAVGDLDGLRARFDALRAVAAERREAVAAERAAAKEQALKERTAIVERAEAISQQDPARTQWKNSGAELRELLEQWKAAQRRGPRLDRGRLVEALLPRSHRLRPPPSPVLQ